MTKEQLILKYNPANAVNLKAEDYLEMRALTDDQISVLAEAYPNQPSRKSYLRLYDTTLQPHKQLYQLSTWQNLRNVRKYSAKKNLIAYDFYQVGAKAAAKAVKPPTGAPKKVVVDMTAQEAADELRKTLKPAMMMAKDVVKTEIKKPVGRPKKVEAQPDQNFDDAT
jgi:hypothetical protein